MTTDVEQILTDDDIHRRRVVQALGVLGGASIAGCMGDEGEDPPESGNEYEDKIKVESDESTTDDPIEELRASELISAHNQAISGVSYTVDVTLQGEETDPDTIKEITYQRDGAGQLVVSVEEVSTIDDGVGGLQQIFTPDTQYTRIELDTGEELTAETDHGDLSDYVPIQITGSSLFRRFLGGATFRLTSGSESEEYSTEYRIVDHNRFDGIVGNIVIRDSDIIEEFNLEWKDSISVDRWIVFSLSDVGTTSVQLL